MKTNNKQKLLNQDKKLHIRPLAIVLPIVLVGYIVSQLVSAASSYATVELESTSTSVFGPAQRLSDPTASGGGAVQFVSQSAGALAVPPKFVGGYLEWWSGLYPSQIDSRYTLLFHAFATVNSDGSLSLPLSVNRQQLAYEYKSLKNQGKPVLLSVGGAGGAAAGLTSQSQVQNFINSVNPLVQEFGFSGIDWDLEYNVPGGISVDGLVTASRQLKNTHGNNFAITMAPFEGIEYPYKDIARLLGNDLTFVGFQYYNMADKVSPQNAISRMEEWMRDSNLRQDQFSLGFWYGPDDWKKYTVEESLMATIYQSVRTKYPQVRGTWTWAIATTDRPRGYQFASILNGVVY